MPKSTLHSRILPKDQQAYARITGQEDDGVPDRPVPVLMPLSVREELSTLAKARQMQKGEFLEQFMHGAFDLMAGQMRALSHQF